MIEACNLTGVAGIRHGFFTREGGVSEGLYAGLNTGYGSGDDPLRVTENRRRLAARLGTDAERLLTVWQWHSADVVEVAAPWDVRRPPKGDAMVTDRPGMALGILSADCTPVLFASADGAVVGAAHAGWKGAHGGVLAATVARMRALGARDIHAAIGPTISQANYEVGPEFHDRFVAQDPASARLFAPAARPGHFLFDLPGFVAAALEPLGLASVARAAPCTYADEARFFSFRRTTHRGEPDYGRQMSAIMIATEGT